jgi:nicotinamide riboside kinase
MRRTWAARRTFCRTAIEVPRPSQWRMKIAIVGAESSGKTTLARQLVDALRGQGHDAAMVAEYLREFCDLRARTPLQQEQAQIAQEQTRRIDEAATKHALLVADTSALMIAVYSEIVFGDRSLYDNAMAAHRRCDLTLLTALGLPWQADGLQRDGPHVREPVQALLRSALARGGIGYSVVSGVGEARLQAALAAATHALAAGAQDQVTQPAARWRSVCERCGDADCERHALLEPSRP